MNTLYRAALGIVIVICCTLAGAGAASAAYTQPIPPPPPTSCVVPSAADGTTITVDAHGDATSPARPGKLDYRCAYGQWHRIYIEATPWQRVKAYCHRTRVCVRPSHRLRAALGIRPGVRAWERPEDDAAGHLSTFVWVRQPGGAVRTYAS